MGNETYKALGYILQGEPQGILHGRTYERAEQHWHQYLE